VRGCIAGVGLGIALGHDLRAHAYERQKCDATVDRFVAVTPHRFALPGPIGPIDPLLTTTTTHDVQYADVKRLHSLAEHRALVDFWRSEERPIYLVSSRPRRSSFAWSRFRTSIASNSIRESLEVQAVDVRHAFEARVGDVRPNRRRIARP
jgi:hypothetical protein